MPLYDFKCDDCGKPTAVAMSVKEYGESSVVCEHCTSAHVHRVYSVPVIVGGKSSYDSNIKKMKQSFRERFVSSGEMDQVKHDHGSQFNDSLVSAAATRIKENKSDELDQT